MKIMFFLHFIISLVIFLLTSLAYIRNYKLKKIREIVNYLLLIGFLYALLSLLSFSWFLKVFNYTIEDFTLTYSLLIMLESALFFIMTYSLFRNKKLFYLLIPYIIIFLVFVFFKFSSFHYYLIISFSLMVLIFFYLSKNEEAYQNLGYAGIFYASLSIAFEVLLLFGIGDIYVFSFFSEIIFLFFIFLFSRVVKENPPPLKAKKKKRRAYFVVFLREFLFVLVFVNLVFIGSVVVHEFGHFSMSKFYKCKYQSIVYEGGLPRTEILCGDLPSNKIVLAGGVLFPILIGLILVVIGGVFTQEIGFLMIGFDLIISYKDFIDLNISDNLIFITIIIGIAFLVIGILKLVKSKTTQFFYL